MTEKEKMLASLPYNSRDVELLEMYHSAREWMSQYNQLNSRAMNERKSILEKMLNRCDDQVWIEAPFYVDYGQLISIGKGSFVNMGCMFLDNNFITIGEHALIGPGVHIYTASHPKSLSERFIGNSENGAGYKTTSQPVDIGDNVWIGGRAIILPGVTIGNNVIIGAGSVVNKDIPDNSTAYGNPISIIES